MALYFNLAKIDIRLASVFLVGASFTFYGYWSIRYLPLLASSILVNYVFGRLIARTLDSSQKKSKSLLWIAVVSNLLILIYYKYSNFFIDDFNELFGTGFSLGKVILPLGVSFFTFTQIAFLVDAYKGKISQFNFVHYCLFVTYFPHLIAGPILHHGSMIPQFADEDNYKFKMENFSIGFAWFVVGLFKKVVIADTFSRYSDPIFAAVDGGVSPTFIVSWIAVLAFAFQIYFDFSGYTDMAIGISKIFGIQLPVNFDSPYKATNIVQFWRKWHISLSNFLRDYLYIPLGGSKKGKPRRYLNLMLTMTLGGLWHGANWTFVVWGVLHGLFLSINHLWNETARKIIKLDRISSPAWLKVAFTFFITCIAWTFFRASDVNAAFRMLEGMLLLNGFSLPQAFSNYQPLFSAIHLKTTFTGIFMGLASFNIQTLLLFFTASGIIIWGAPNTQKVLNTERIYAMSKQKITLSILVLGIMFVTSITNFSQIQTFIYFQF
jgi:alginate O-acetyltransferase complex protein AlgI